MGLYDDRLSELSESRRTRRVAQRRTSPVQSRPTMRPERARFGGPRPREAKAPSMSAQSLLFKRDAGWTESKAKSWAKANGYRYGKVDITDQYVRLRQSDPKGSTVKRTIPFGRGIRAVVAREEMNSMATTRKTRHRRPAKKKKASRKAPRRKTAKRSKRRVKKVHAVAARRRKRVRRVESRGKSRRRVAARTSHVMEAKRTVRRRRRRPAVQEAWKGDPAGHAKAAKKGHRRKKARSAVRRKRKRKSSKRARETTYAAAPRRRRHKARRSSMVMEAKRPRHRRSRKYRMSASRGGGSGMGLGGVAVAVLSGGIGFVLADGIDRLLATYNPSATTPLPTDKFTSSGAGTLANTLNVAATPNWKRLAAGTALTAVPAVSAMYVKNKMVRGSLEGLAVGAGINLFKTLWSNLLMPLLTPKDTSTASLQKSYIARLYPAEVAAHINAKQTPPIQQVSSAGSGALSGAQADVGPFALADDSPYPTAAQALRNAAGVSGDSPYPTAAQALRNATGVHGDSPYPTAAQALRNAAGVSAPGPTGPAYQPGPPAGPGPGPQTGKDASCGCIGESNPFLSFVDSNEGEAAA